MIGWMDNWMDGWMDGWMTPGTQRNGTQRFESNRISYHIISYHVQLTTQMPCMFLEAKGILSVSFLLGPYEYEFQSYGTATNQD